MAISPNRRWRYAVLLLLLLVGVALRLAPLRHEALDGDEMFSRRVALMPAPAALAAIREDIVHPPAYYFVLKAGVAVWGADAIGLRLWSILFGSATILLVAAIGGVLPRSRFTGLLAAALVAVNSSLIVLSQEARSYAFYTFLVMLLVLWVWAVTAKPRSSIWWACGALLMTVLVYTHYVAAVYVFYAVVAVALCSQPMRTKRWTAAVALVAAVALLPWLYAVSGAYRARHGIGENLDWQGHPTLYDLKQILALSVGVLPFKGATSLSLLMVAALSIAALLLFARRQSLCESPVLLTVAMLAFLPPVTIFLLSEPPINLPLFALRHVLPSLPLLGVLCCYGVEALVRSFGSWHRAVAAAGAALVLTVAALSTVAMLRSSPTRYPYDVIGHTLQQHPEDRAFTTWFYGIGEPVNFYCKAVCVHALPAIDAELPPTFLLLYRPTLPNDLRHYRSLLKEGYTEAASAYYTDGQHEAYGTTVAHLVKSPPTAAAKLLNP